MKTILFQGDSITDAGRSRSEDRFNRGYGYPTVVSALLGSKYPGEYNFINRGVSGNRIVDMYARIKCDVLNLKPDYMSVLIGVNDVWHEFGASNGISAEKFEKLYIMFIEEILEALPDLRIFILGPYVADGSATHDVFSSFSAEVALRAQAAKRVAAHFGLPYIDLQKTFDDAFMSAPSDYWLNDGVHPLAPGHGLIAERWIETFEKLK